MTEVLSYTLWSVAGVVAAYFVLHFFWRAKGSYRVWRAGPRPLFGARHRIWRDPGVVERRDLTAGPGGPSQAPVAPFRFIEEHTSGSQPTISVHDANGRRWRVKWGPEVQPETFAVRLAWACGYFAEITHLVASGTIVGGGPLTRAAACVDKDGGFVDGRFELDDPDVEKLFEEHSWSWIDNPFVGTPELAGLKIILMLISNWDNKDQRDVARGSNTAIYVTRVSRWKREAQYLIVDWGGSMGKWGGTIVTRGRWDAAGFAAQTPQFVTGVAGGFIQFGYTGQRTADARSGIRVEDVQWLCRYLGRVTDDQLRAALAASGATAEENASFTASLRDRIQQLQRTAAVPAPGSGLQIGATGGHRGLVRAVGGADQGSSGQGWRG